MRPIESEKPVVAPEKARQGRWGWQVFMVLISSLALAAIMWFGVEMYGNAIAPEQPGQTTQ